MYIKPLTYNIIHNTFHGCLNLFQTYNKSILENLNSILTQELFLKLTPVQSRVRSKSRPKKSLSHHVFPSSGLGHRFQCYPSLDYPRAIHESRLIAIRITSLSLLFLFLIPANAHIGILIKVRNSAAEKTNCPRCFFEISYDAIDPVAVL